MLYKHTPPAHTAMQASMMRVPICVFSQRVEIHYPLCMLFALIRTLVLKESLLNRLVELTECVF